MALDPAFRIIDTFAVANQVEEHGVGSGRGAVDGGQLWLHTESVCPSQLRGKINPPIITSIAI
jgi:hypothetical protein